MLNDAYAVKQFYTEPGKDTGPLSLSLFISPGSFSYAISTSQFKTITELCHIQFIASHLGAASLTDSVDFLVRNYMLDRKKFEKVNVALLNTAFAMIPEAYATQEVLKPLLKFTTGDEQIKQVWQHGLSGMKFCFTPEDELVKYLERSFPNASLRHAGAVSIQLFSAHHSLKNCSVFLQIHEGFIELAAKNKNDLLFYNVFNYDTGEDILYYLLFMMEQLGLDPSTAKLGIAAEKAVDDDFMKQIVRYVEQVQFCASDASVVLSGELSTSPSHFYFTLLNQHLCEL